MNEFAEQIMRAILPEAVSDAKSRKKAFQDALGHEVKFGDWIQFQSVGLKLWGEVEEIIPGDKEKYVITTLGMVMKVNAHM